MSGRFRWILRLAVLSAAMAASPAMATYSTTCTGLRDTPDVIISLGEGVYDLHIYTPDHDWAGWGWRQLPAQSYKEIRIVLRNQHGGRLGLIRLRPPIKPRENVSYVGTMILGKRKYWLSCDELG